MLSSKVIMAVEILLTLGPSERDVRDRESQPGTDLSFFASERCCKSLFRATVIRLMQGGYIVRTGGKCRYALMKDPAGITLQHLISLFHGDICIGEAYAHHLTLGRENFHTASCRNLYRWETMHLERLHAEFSGLPITAFRDFSSLRQADA